MAINFFEAQKKLRSRTWLFLFLFFLLAVGVALLIEVVVAKITVPPEGGGKPVHYLGVLFLGITFLIAGFYYLSYRSFGGKMVAQSLGAKEVSPETNNFKEKQFINIAHEMAIASHQPIPALYILEAKEINAFAAGIKPDNAAITVTRGALEYLDRDELQGVVAHEFGHIYNGDMRISMRLAALVMAFMIVFYLGIRLLQGSMLFRGGGQSRKGSPVTLVAMALLLGGLVTWFAGTVLRASVSRQREYLADACAVQFTRNPSGIANALRKIGRINERVRDMPTSGMGYSHLYFDHKASIFATHPPLQKRIAAIEQWAYAPLPNTMQRDPTTHDTKEK